MMLREWATQKVKSTAVGLRLVGDRRYRMLAKSVVSLAVHLLFAFYNGILGAMSASVILVSSAAYYFFLASMRFSAVMLERKSGEHNPRRMAVTVGSGLIVLSILYQVMVFVSMKYQTAVNYGTIPMITIATFTFTKITLAVMTAVKHRKDKNSFFRAVNAIRYAEVAVSLLTMQQSMLVTFREGDGAADVILNACTGAGVCLFIFAVGIRTLQWARRNKDGNIENRKGI